MTSHVEGIYRKNSSYRYKVMNLLNQTPCRYNSSGTSTFELSGGNALQNLDCRPFDKEVRYWTSIWSGIVGKHRLHVLSSFYTAAGVNWFNMYRLLACSGTNRKAANEVSDDFFIPINHSFSAESHSSSHLFLSYFQDIENMWILWSLSAVMNIHYSSEDAQFGPLNPSLRIPIRASSTPISRNPSYPRSLGSAVSGQFFVLAVRKINRRRCRVLEAGSQAKSLSMVFQQPQCHELVRLTLWSSIHHHNDSFAPKYSTYLR